MCAMSPRLLRPLASGFNPRQIAGLLAWWDASDASTVTLDSGRVAELRDKSGNSRHATNAASGSTQPDYIAAGRNNLNVARYATADQTILNIPSTPVPNSHTAFHVFWRPSASTVTVGIGTTGTSPYTFNWFTNNVLYESSNASFTTHEFSTETGGFVVTMRRTGTTEVLSRRNFSLLASVTSGGGVTNGVTGSWDALGSRDGSSSQGDLAEILLYDNALSDAQIDVVEQFLARKWGLSYP
jgi:hypothetical protein